MIPLEDFFEAYYECRRHKRNTINALQFEVNYEENLVKLWEEVNSRNYNIGRSICFLVTRPKLREVFAADFRDRIIHHVIMQRLEPLFEEAFIEDNYNCRKGKGTLYGIRRLHQMIKECSNNYTEDCYIGKFDLQGFFMTIDKRILWQMLKTFIKNKYTKNDIDLLLYLSHKIIANRPQDNCIRKSPIKMWNDLPPNKSLFTCDQMCGMPIGNLTSQCLANFYLHKFDNWVKYNFIYYGRYVDDFFIISKTKTKLTRYVSIIKHKLYSELKVKLHPDKIYIQHYSKGVNFIGATIKKQRMYIANRSVCNLYNTIHRFNDIGNNTNEQIIHFFQSLNSYYGFLKHYFTFNIKLKMNRIINVLWESYFYISDNYQKFILKEENKPNIIQINNIKQFGYDTRR